MSLSLARLLQKNEYSVLLIDCDITGTSVTTAACHSSVWRDDVNPLKLDGKDINLLDFFKNQYLKGLSEGKTVCETAALDSGKVNVLGSEIYGEDNGVIISPSVLTDELHSFWFVSMLKELADSFSSKQPEDRNVAIIIDNSPGYVGIGHAIHEWLGELGPSRAKCLMVSSLDEQDLQSCEGATREIENTITRYANAVQYYHDLKKGIEPTVKYDSFEKSKAESFFYDLVDKNGEGRTQVDSLPVEKYVALVLNKIPTEYANADTMKNLLRSFNGDQMDYVLRTCQNGNNIIEENPFLGRQFYVNRLEHKSTITSLQEEWQGYSKIIIKAYNDWNQRGPEPKYLAKVISNLNDALDNLPVGDIEYLKQKQILWLMNQIRTSLFDNHPPLISLLFENLSFQRMKEVAETQLRQFNDSVDDYAFDWPDSKYMRVILEYLIKHSSTNSNVGLAQRIVTAITFRFLLEEYAERLKNDHYREGDQIYKEYSINALKKSASILYDAGLKGKNYQDICLSNCNNIIGYMNHLLPRLSNLGSEIDFWLTVLEVQYDNPMVSVLTQDMRDYMHDRFDLCKSDQGYSKALGSVRHEYEIYNTELTLQEYVLKQWGV